MESTPIAAVGWCTVGDNERAPSGSGDNGIPDPVPEAMDITGTALGMWVDAPESTNPSDAIDDAAALRSIGAVEEPDAVAEAPAGEESSGSRLSAITVAAAAVAMTEAVPTTASVVSIGAADAAVVPVSTVSGLKAAEASGCA